MLENIAKRAESATLLSAPHQDEFPVAYSLAGCSPAEPASASATATIFNHQRPFAKQIWLNGNCPQRSLSQLAAHPTYEPQPFRLCDPTAEA